MALQFIILEQNNELKKAEGRTNKTERDSDPSCFGATELFSVGVLVRFVVDESRYPVRK
jgi:hypothetical protein